MRIGRTFLSHPLYSCAAFIGAPLTFVERSCLSPFGGCRCLSAVGDLFFPYFQCNAIIIIFFLCVCAGLHLRSRPIPSPGTSARKALPPCIPLLLHNSLAPAKLEELSRLIGQMTRSHIASVLCIAYRRQCELTVQSSRVSLR